MDVPKVRGVTLKGTTLVEVYLNGPGTTREISDRVARHYGYDEDLYWGAAGKEIEQALVENLAPTHLPVYLAFDGEVWSAVKKVPAS